ncbi:MAG TPA: polysaccharide ABC transporter ATP-binding protein [Allosphingosinicella sp.]|nr:polysaccharide ABC transporter ATP-binding protein [Allosphingosinicella sp.]
MGEAVLEVAGLSKRFSRDLRSAAHYALRDIVDEILRPAAFAGLRPREFWALEDVSFALERGEALCVAGHNGAGKSTLLKLLYGLIKPDRGEIRIRGRTEALIELGAGFNPNLTGRENVDLAGAIDGRNARDTGRLVDAVVEFAELAAFIDAPVLTYSSGMRARLAFALAISLEPDLLLVDEVLAVGDPHFQRKCVNFMRSHLDKGGSLLFVSHNAHQVQAVCDRGILLDAGRLVFAGTAVETVSRMLAQRPGETAPADDRPDANSPIVIEGLSITPEGVSEVRTGEAIRVILRYNATQAVDVYWGFSIMTRDQWTCVTGGSDLDRTRLEPGRGELSCMVRELPLLPGLYVVRAAINEASSLMLLASCGWKGPGLTLEVSATPDLLTNAQVQQGQLVKLDIDWNAA